MAKVHIGLVAPDKSLEAEIQDAAQPFGGAYIHQSNNILELGQKLQFQKIQVILIVLPSQGEGSEISAIYHFIRGKKDLQTIPIGLLTESSEFEIPFLSTDTSLRSFPLKGGVFMALLCMAPLLQSNRPPEGAITSQWIEQEFLESLRAKVGQSIQFQVSEASDDEMHGAFFSQGSEEIRTHLGWFKFTARWLESGAGGIAQLFQGLSRDGVEAVAQNLVSKVIDEFEHKVKAELSVRGAVFLPEIDKLNAVERKWIYSQARHRGILFSAAECQVLLQISQYI